MYYAYIALTFFFGSLTIGYCCAYTIHSRHAWARMISYASITFVAASMITVAVNFGLHG